MWNRVANRVELGLLPKRLSSSPAVKAVKMKQKKPVLEAVLPQAMGSGEYRNQGASQDAAEPSVGCVWRG